MLISHAFFCDRKTCRLFIYHVCVCVCVLYRRTILNHRLMNNIITETIHNASQCNVCYSGAKEKKETKSRQSIKLSTNGRNKCHRNIISHTLFILYFFLFSALTGWRTRTRTINSFQINRPRLDMRHKVMSVLLLIFFYSCKINRQEYTNFNLHNRIITENDWYFSTSILSWSCNWLIVNVVLSSIKLVANAIRIFRRLVFKFVVYTLLSVVCVITTNLLLLFLCWISVRAERPQSLWSSRLNLIRKWI